jgi:hypothetical protein
VPHQQRLVLVDRQADVLLANGQLQPDAAFLDAVAGDELRQLRIQPETGLLEVDGVDRVRRARPR